MNDQTLRLPTTGDESELGKLAREIETDHQNAQHHLASWVFHAVEVGRKLNLAKKLVRHGEWLPWLQENCQFSARTAQTYMQIHRHVEAMPDCRGKLSDLSLGNAEEFLRDQFERRHRKLTRAFFDVTRSFHDHLIAAQSDLREAKEIVGDVEWNKWLASCGLDPVDVDAWMASNYPKKEIGLLPLPTNDASDWEEPVSRTAARRASGEFSNTRNFADLENATAPIIETPEEVVT